MAMPGTMARQAPFDAQTGPAFIAQSDHLASIVPPSAKVNAAAQSNQNRLVISFNLVISTLSFEPKMNHSSSVESVS